MTHAPLHDGCAGGQCHACNALCSRCGATSKQHEFREVERGCEIATVRAALAATEQREDDLYQHLGEQRVLLEQTKAGAVLSEEAYLAACKTNHGLLALLAEATTRLNQYTGMCVCPGMSCVESCSECHRTQSIVNKITNSIR